MEFSSSRIDGLELTSIISFASDFPPISTNISMAATRKPDATRGLPRQREGRFGWRIRQRHLAARTSIHPSQEFRDTPLI